MKEQGRALSHIYMSKSIPKTPLVFNHAWCRKGSPAHFLAKTGGRWRRRGEGEGTWSTVKLLAQSPFHMSLTQQCCGLRRRSTVYFWWNILLIDTRFRLMCFTSNTITLYTIPARYVETIQSWFPGPLIPKQYFKHGMSWVFHCEDSISRQERMVSRT